VERRRPALLLAGGDAQSGSDPRPLPYTIWLLAMTSSAACDDTRKYLASERAGSRSSALSAALTLRLSPEASGTGFMS